MSVPFQDEIRPALSLEIESRSVAARQSYTQVANRMILAAGVCVQASPRGRAGAQRGKFLTKRRLRVEDAPTSAGILRKAPEGWIEYLETPYSLQPGAGPISQTANESAAQYDLCFRDRATNS
jgi:hypothetical protein